MRYILGTCVLFVGLLLTTTILRAAPNQTSAKSAEVSDLQKIQLQKLDTIILSDITFNKLSLVEAVDRLQVLASKADGKLDSEKKGINIILKMESPDKYVVSIEMKTPTLKSALIRIAQECGLSLSVEKYGVAFSSK